MGLIEAWRAAFPLYWRVGPFVVVAALAAEENRIFERICSWRYPTRLFSDLVLRKQLGIGTNDNPQRTTRRWHEVAFALGVPEGHHTAHNAPAFERAV
jgi:hypothetical protein